MATNAPARRRQWRRMDGRRGREQVTHTITSSDVLHGRLVDREGGNSIDLKISGPNLGDFPGCCLTHNIAPQVVCTTSDMFNLTLWTKLEIFVCPKLWKIKSSLNCHQEFQLDWTRGPPASDLLRLDQHAAEPLRRHTQILWRPQMPN